MVDITKSDLPQCCTCEHLYRDKSFTEVFKCKAYPDRVPDEIYHNKHDHRRAFRGDGGVRYKRDESISKNKG